MVYNAARLEGAARGLPEDGLVAVTWAGAALATSFVGLRCYARINEFQRLFPDDCWVISGLVVLLVNATLQTLQAHSLYYIVYSGAGLAPAGQELLDQGNVYVRYEIAIIGLFWTVTWCVKASFLALYWRLFDGSPDYRRLWWPVSVFTALAYVGCWFASVWTCHPPSTYFDFGQCAKPIDDRGSTISISYSTGVDILSDLLIMLLPMRLLQTMRITRIQKVALGSIFCVGWMIVVFAIVRATQILGRARTDPVGLAVWGVVESSVSVVAGCLPALRRYVCGALGRKLRRETRTLSWRAPRMRSYDEPLTTAPISRSSGRSCSIVLQDRSDSRNDAASAHISIPAKA